MSWNRKTLLRCGVKFIYVFTECANCKVDPLEMWVEDIWNWTIDYPLYKVPRKGSIRDKLDYMAVLQHRTWHKIRVHMLQK